MTITQSDKASVLLAEVISHATPIDNDLAQLTISRALLKQIRQFLDEVEE